MAIKIKAKKNSKKKATLVKETRPDHLFRAVLDGFAIMPKQLAATQRSGKKLLRTVFETAQRIYLLRTKHYDWLDRQIRSEGRSITDWIDQGMAPVAMMGHTPRELINAVGSGMTLEELKNKGARLFLGEVNREALAQRIARAVTPTKPKEQLSSEERLEEYEHKFKELDVMVHDLLSANAGLRKRNLELEAEHKRFVKVQKLVA